MAFFNWFDQVGVKAADGVPVGDTKFWFVVAVAEKVGSFTATTLKV